MNKKILSDLGNYLLAHCEEIVGEWLEAVEQNPDISSLAHLKDEEELADHLPETLSETGEAPKGSPIGSKSRRGNPRARVHGKYRWRQGYRLEEVIREASVIRRIISHNWLDAYAPKVPALDSGTRRGRKISFTKPWTMLLVTRPSSLSKNS